MGRELQKIVRGLIPLFGGESALLAAIEAQMWWLRGVGRGLEPRIESRLANLGDLCRSDDALGQVYQAINAPALDRAYRATARTGRKFTAEEIPAVTQLFTPRWVIEFLLQNTLGRAWRHMHPDTKLRKSWSWFVDSDACEFEMPRRIRDLRICDPACGTMNFGLIALEMLRAMYLEEIDRAGAAGWPKSEGKTAAEIDSSILSNNLFGFDIDPIAIDLARRTLGMKIGRPLRADECNLVVADALFDESLNRKDSSGFHIIVTNPPYLSARNLSPDLVSRMKARYPTGWRDAYACFILRSLELLMLGGRAGILSMHSFMFTAAFEKLRGEIGARSVVETVAHFGPGLFDIGNPGTLQTTALVVRRGNSPRHRAVFFRLVDSDDKQKNLAEATRSTTSYSRHEIHQDDIHSMPRRAWMYWISPAMRRAFTSFPKLGSIASPRQGLATTDNARFVRYWWEVELPRFPGPRTKWFPYAKGGRFRRWFEAARHRVNWEEDGKEIKQSIIDRYPYLNGEWQWVAKNSQYYGRPGITYSYLTSGNFSARRLEEGTLFDVAGSSLFPQDSLAMLGILNSSTTRQLLAAINPTVNFQVGDLRQLPIPPQIPEVLRVDVAAAIELTRQLDRFDQTSPEFCRPAAWDGLQLLEIHAKLGELQHRIDCCVAELYGIERETAEKNPRFSPDRSGLARQWISYALGIWLGRWGEAARGDIAILAPLDRRLTRDLREILAKEVGEESAVQIEREVDGFERFLPRECLAWQNQVHRNRPVIWGFSQGGRTVAVHGFTANRKLVGHAFKLIGAGLPFSWRRHLDDGIAINLAPLVEWVAGTMLQKNLRPIARDLMSGRYGFSQTGQQIQKDKKVKAISTDECALAPLLIRPAPGPILSVKASCR
ncbi:MAG: BREX-1 system adenine-specific DNA-methyltransferase PglX [Planctomycetota bacterium]|nr:BREX-1 system adenine-specific DNA-methyltransferase PglX [Planctomycetota bacterium]